MRVAVVGSRDIYLDITKHIDDLGVEVDLIVSGGARGVDTCAENYAKDNNIPTMIIKPNYDKFGKRAPLLRNIEIVQNADIVMAFWDGESRGTEFTINQAKKQNKIVKIYMSKKS